MKAIRLHAIDDLRVEEVPVPEIAAGEVLVRVGAALICGTDIRMWRNGAKVTPVVLGHETAGTIAEVGRDVRHYKAGMRVAVAPNWGCGICDACVAGRGQDCASLRAMGIHVDGGFAEYLRVPAAAVAQGNISSIEGSVSFAAAALAEPFSCVYNSFERAALKPGDSVVVIGAGPIGLLHAKLYRLAGAGLVAMIDVNADRLAACVRDDPSIVAIPSEGAKERLMELTGGSGADIVVAAASNAAVQQLAFGLAALHGRVIFFGGLPAGKEIVALDTNVIHYRQIFVTGTSRQSLSQYRRCLALISKGLMKVDGLLTHSWKLDEAGAAFAASARGEGLKTGFVME